ncbi:MAG: hypothetical protein AVDCRST_MAG38-2839 [uncultured Solirubrobacteraceae bacterium]|uniref:Uncharacterized protein n=1 Tax=uncultured Solirubrobacteraceae bacterium TaxID=1162706 RepID=A0A6J4SFG4_9ACTN|nr:MAG: hypothetical protein AVDCRST_MAG38-2839 [uncultured Solirubrobacteraceae bacterium]
MPQQPMTSGARAGRGSTTAQHMTHARTHHTTPSRTRDAGALAPLAGRWRDSALARASLVDYSA